MDSGPGTSSMFATIGVPDDPKPNFRELTSEEILKPDFTDFFRFSATMRLDRDDALVLRNKLEAFLSQELAHMDSYVDPRVYLGIKNDD